MKISFIGLGQMGRGMALNLSKANLDLMVSDINDEVLKEFASKNVKTTKNVKDTIDSDIIFLCLPDEKIVENVLFGVNDIVRNGQIIVDFSTINYMSALKIAKRVEEKGAYFVDAPISGMQSKAEDGTLAIMCGGEEAIYNQIKELLEYMGTNILFMGKHGNGQLTKMINNCIYDINCAAIAELLPMAVKLGLDPEQIGNVINNGTGRSYASEYFVPRMLNRDFKYGFTLRNAYKDLVSASEVAYAESIPTPVLDATASIYKMTMLTGYEDLYKGALICLYEDLLGVKFEKNKLI
jgi:3-hydroxyisobutyrate dehydrogenase-like beta-hydroxyacid dehydrogenase